MPAVKHLRLRLNKCAPLDRAPSKLKRKQRSFKTRAKAEIYGVLFERSGDVPTARPGTHTPAASPSPRLTRPCPFHQYGSQQSTRAWYRTSIKKSLPTVSSWHTKRCTTKHLGMQPSTQAASPDLVHALSGALLMSSSLAFSQAVAQDYPSKPVTLVVCWHGWRVAPYD